MARTTFSVAAHSSDRGGSLANAELAAVTAADRIATAVASLEAAGYVVRKRTVVERAVVEKADSAVVAAYFSLTGLNRKEIADAVGVCVSVIATVQNPNGDRWSATRFAAAQILIDAYVAAKANASAGAAI